MAAFLPRKKGDSENLSGAAGRYVLKSLQAQDVFDGYGEVYLPNALSKKYPSAARNSALNITFRFTTGMFFRPLKQYLRWRLKMKTVKGF